MDKSSKGLVIIAALVVIAAGSHYLWSSYRNDLETKCETEDVIVSAFHQVLIEAERNKDLAVKAYNNSIKDCVKRGGPI
jgi:hypothetical protein